MYRPNNKPVCEQVITCKKQTCQSRFSSNVKKYINYEDPDSQNLSTSVKGFVLTIRLTSSCCRSFVTKQRRIGYHSCQYQTFLAARCFFSHARFVGSFRAVGCVAFYRLLSFWFPVLEFRLYSDLTLDLKCLCHRKGEHHLYSCLLYLKHVHPSRHQHYQVCEKNSEFSKTLQNVSQTRTQINILSKNLIVF